ncbi:uncharacterized protein LOC117646140 [Thrips palmi]|uniref:Uncharacterized protein LOC117646140 n=1 Tax=Thrips palmi TaxID=161013 RepID=A0A6P8Z7F4_THRPL|nr:uncharacterized protein LOC117646140 [Thrips palmi]
MARLITFIALVCICLAAAMMVAGEHKPPPHKLAKRAGKWSISKAPGSPTKRGTLKGPHGSELHKTEDDSGTKTTGKLFKGKPARYVSPPREGQPHSGGEASTSKGKKKGH